MTCASRMRREAGTALMEALLVSLIVAGMASAYLLDTMSHSQVTDGAIRSEVALQIAESGIDDAVNEMNTVQDAAGDGVGNVDGSIGGGAYAVTIDPPFDGPGVYTLLSSAAYGREQRAVEAVVYLKPVKLFQFGAFSAAPYVLDSNATVDSYDSSKGSYASQIAGSYNGRKYANQNGHIGSNARITLDSNALVFGDSSGLNGTRLNGNSRVFGSTEPLPANRDLPDVSVPPELYGYPAVRRHVNGNSSATLASGDYHFSSLTTDSNSTLTIQGPSRILVEQLVTDSNSRILIDATNGPVVFYGTGEFRLNSNSDMNAYPNRPQDLQIFLTTDNSSGSPPVEIDSNAVLQAAVYAPNAHIRLDSNGVLYGAVVAHRIAQASNFPIHYDESLADLEFPGGRFAVRMWREIPPP